MPTSIVVKISFLKIYLNSLSGLKVYDFVVKGNTIFFGDMEINKLINIPSQILPMALLRPISGNASLAIMTNIFSIYGPDSFAGRLASVLQGCTDTTIYVIALYYSSIKVSKTRYTIIVGLLADAVGIIMGFILTNIFF